MMIMRPNARNGNTSTYLASSIFRPIDAVEKQCFSEGLWALGANAWWWCVTVGSRQERTRRSEACEHFCTWNPGHISGRKRGSGAMSMWITYAYTLVYCHISVWDSWKTVKGSPGGLSDSRELNRHCRRKLAWKTSEVIYAENPTIAGGSEKIPQFMRKQRIVWGAVSCQSRPLYEDRNHALCSTFLSNGVMLLIRVKSCAIRNTTIVEMMMFFVRQTQLINGTNYTVFDNQAFSKSTSTIILFPFYCVKNRSLHTHND